MRRAMVVAVALVCAFVAVRVAHVGQVATGPTSSASVPAPPSLAPGAAPSPATIGTADNATIARAFANHARDVRVDGEGTVSRVLSDDNQGERHQRFLVRLPSGQSILIAHNIDIAPRVQNLRVGNEIEFAGEFVWNEKGGLVHWTHHDPSGRRRAGWLKYGGRTYQ